MGAELGKHGSDPERRPVLAKQRKGRVTGRCRPRRFTDLVPRKTGDVVCLAENERITTRLCQRDGLLDVRDGGRLVTKVERHERRQAVREGAERLRAGPRIRMKTDAQPAKDLGLVRPDVPVGGDRHHQPQDLGALTGFVEPGERAAQVGQIGVQPRQPGELRLARAQVAPGLLRQRQAPDRMAVPGRRLLAASRQLITGKLADGLQHRKAGLGARWFFPADQVLVQQRTDPVQGVGPEVNQSAGDGLRRLEREATGEDRQVAEERLLVRGQQVVTPGDRVAHRALACGQIASAAGQQGQPRLQASQERGRREHLDPRRGQLDRQRQAVDAATDLSDGVRVVWREDEVRLDRLGPRHEQADRRAPGDLLDTAILVQIGQFKRRNRELVLPGDAQADSAGDEDRYLRTGAEQVRHDRGRLDEVFKIVEHEQLAFVSQEDLQPVERQLVDRPLARRGRQ